LPAADDFYAEMDRALESVRTTAVTGGKFSPAAVNYRSASGETLLIAASKAANLYNVAALITAGADVNVMDNDGRTALYYALHNSRNCPDSPDSMDGGPNSLNANAAEVTRLLCMRHLERALIERDSDACLYLLAVCDNVPYRMFLSVLTLLQSNAVSSRWSNHHKGQLLSFLQRWKSKDGASLIDAQGYNMQTTLHLASMHNQVDMVIQLLAMGGRSLAVRQYDVLPQNQDCIMAVTPIKYAIGLSSAASLNAFIRRDPSLRDAPCMFGPHGEPLFTPLSYAVISGSEVCVRALLALGASPLATGNMFGLPAMHLAASTGQLGSAAALGMNRETLSVMLSSGETPTHIACRNGKVEMVRAFLQHGADPRAAPLPGMLTPLQVAEERGYLACAQAIRDHFQIVRGEDPKVASVVVPVAGWALDRQSMLQTIVVNNRNNVVLDSTMVRIATWVPWPEAVAAKATEVAVGGGGTVPVPVAPLPPAAVPMPGVSASGSFAPAADAAPDLSEEMGWETRMRADLCTALGALGITSPDSPVVTSIDSFVAASWALGLLSMHRPSQGEARAGLGSAMSRVLDSLSLLPPPATDSSSRADRLAMSNVVHTIIAGVAGLLGNSPLVIRATGGNQLAEMSLADLGLASPPAVALYARADSHLWDYYEATEGVPLPLRSMAVSHHKALSAMSALVSRNADTAGDALDTVLGCIDRNRQLAIKLKVHRHSSLSYLDIWCCAGGSSVVIS
jgi:ankyrin repeat protein